MALHVVLRLLSLLPALDPLAVMAGYQYPATWRGKLPRQRLWMRTGLSAKGWFQVEKIPSRQFQLPISTRPGLKNTP